MKRGRLVIGSSLVLLLCATQLLAGQQTKVTPWVKINEKDGIRVYSRDNSLVPLKECMCTGVIDSSAANVEFMLRDWKAYKKIMFMSKKTEQAVMPFCKESPDNYCAYLLQGAPWPVEDRDGYGSISFYVHKPTNEILVKITVRENSMPLTKGVTRIPYCDMEWIIKPIDATHCQLTYQGLTVPGGNIDKIPPSIINWGMKFMGIYTMQNIRKLAREERYQNAKEYITTTPWPDDLRFYAEDKRNL